MILGGIEIAWVAVINSILGWPGLGALYNTGMVPTTALMPGTWSYMFNYPTRLTTRSWASAADPDADIVNAKVASLETT